MKKLETREWVFIMLIVVLIQFIIQASAWLYGGNSGALGYLSFAGTAVSIILAVLAIIYSFCSHQRKRSHLRILARRLLNSLMSFKTLKSAKRHCN